MAVKDHSLDEKIIKAATSEFMEHGFRDASLRKIAQHAGLTTGALYTRYKNKDILFCSLVEPTLREVASDFEPIELAYREAMDSLDPEKFLDAIRIEEEVYINLLYKHYDQCILFFCRSDGSSIQNKVDQMMAEKAKQTTAYFRSISKTDIDFEGIELVLSEQFHFYRQLLQKGYDKEKAVSCIKSLENFMEAGWKDLFQRML